MALAYGKKCGGPLAAAIGLLALLETLKSLLLFVLPEQIHFIVEFAFSFLNAAQEFSDAIADVPTRRDLGAFSLLLLKTVLLVVHLLIIVPIYMLATWVTRKIARLFQ